MNMNTLITLLLTLSSTFGRTAVPANDFLNSIGVNSAIDERFEHKE